MLEKDHIKKIGLELAELVSVDPTEISCLPLWYRKAENLKAMMADLNLTDSMPHFLWHYFSDADIRVKDDVYRSMQLKRIAILVRSLVDGTVPDDDDLDLT
jgi:hypothetical protein